MSPETSIAAAQLRLNHMSLNLEAYKGNGASGIGSIKSNSAYVLNTETSTVEL